MHVFWFILTVALIVLEVVTINLVSIWAAIGSGAALITSFITENTTIQIAVFIIVTIISLILTKKFVKAIRGNAERINLNFKNKKAIVTKKITPTQPGQVKIQGEEWKAIADETIKVGDLVEILDIEGVKLIVRKEVK